jgi:hypothetical protein
MAAHMADICFYPDFAFDWHITWKTAGSRKLSLEFTAFDPAQGQEVSQNLTEYRAAASHDNAELLSEEYFRESMSRADFPSLASRRPDWQPL